MKLKLARVMTPLSIVLFSLGCGFVIGAYLSWGKLMSTPLFGIGLSCTIVAAIPALLGLRWGFLSQLTQSRGREVRLTIVGAIISLILGYGAAGLIYLYLISLSK